MLVLLSFLGALAGCSGEYAEETSPPPAIPRVLPIEGRWIWVTGAQAMPSRNVGCEPGQAKLGITGSRIVMQGDGWSHAVYTIADWHAAGGMLTLTLDDTSAEGRRRVDVDLDVSDTAFVRYLGSRAGAPAQGRHHDAAPDRLAATFTLLRCADASFRTASLLREGAEPERMELRR
jgi:hypothetical protein